MTPEKKFKVLIFGAGAIGSYIGGSLEVQGHEVHFLDRQETLEKIRSHGIELILPQGNFEITPHNLWSSLEEALESHDFDFSIVAVKSFDTDNLIHGWSQLKEKIPPVLCLQNGVENELKMKSILGQAKVISGTVTTAIGRLDHGIIVERLRGIGIENKDKLTNDIITAFQNAGLNAVGYQNSDSMKWSKLLTNLTTNASSAILAMTPEEILGNSQLFKVEIEQLRETIRVMKAHKIPITDLPGTPVKLFASIVEKFPLIFSRMVLKKAISGGRGGKMPSFFLDLHSNRNKSEVDYLNGAVVRYGNFVGVETPVNQILTDTLLRLTNNELLIDEFNHQPEKYLNLFQKSIGIR
jgi:2-dehydropantoate 2-reductase